MKLERGFVYSFAALRALTKFLALRQRMERGFVYSFAALLLVLSILLAITYAGRTGDIVAGDAGVAKAAMEAKSESANADFSGFFYNSGALAVKAASGWRESSNSSFANATCVLTVLVQSGNVTPADCPGEAFPFIGLENQSFSIGNWLALVSGKYNSSAPWITASVSDVAAYDYNASFTGFNATLSVNVSVSEMEAYLNRSYAVAVPVTLSGVSYQPYG